MKTTITLLLLILLPALAVAAFPDLEGLEPAGEPRSYGPDDLWEEINGAAENYLAYGFQRLDSRIVMMDRFGLNIGIYDMGTPLNAFGIFRAECAAGTDTIPIGTAASIYAPWQAVMLKDRYFVKVTPTGGRAPKVAYRTALRAVDHSLPGIMDFPEELDLLPERFREPLSEAYTKESFLGLKELENCVWARYLDDAHRKYRVFAVASKEPADLEAAWAKLSASWEPRAVGRPKVLVREIPYEGPVAVAYTGTEILGLTGIDKEEALLKMLVALVEDE